jgi:hypothetical protein
MAIITVDTIRKEESIYKTLIVGAKGKSSKTKNEDDDELDDDTPVKPGKGAKDDDEDDDSDVDEKDDDWNKGEEGDSWDPDFEEFDLPKSKGKKAPGTSKGGVEEEEDFKVDEEFKDLFAGGSVDDDEDDDF